MKKRIFLIIAIVTAFVANAADAEKEYRKIIEKYDIAYQAKAVRDSSSAVFWGAVLDNNELLLKFQRDMRKNRGAEKEALRRTSQLPRLYAQFDESIARDMQGFCDSLLAETGISALGGNCTLHIVSDEEPYAFTALTDNGFAMCLTTGLVAKTGVTRDVLMGYVAHEFVHGALHHHARSYYDQARKRRKDNLLLGMLAVGVVGAVTAAEALDPTPSDGDTYINDSGNTTVNINTDATHRVPKFFFNYTRDQEHEADLIAFRFMQHLGKEKPYIDGLKILGSTNYDTLFGADSNRPPVVERINFLNYVEEHPELGNTQNRHLKKKRNRHAQE